ncbi:MAG TPA: hypothetical protein VMZ26_09185 [Pyrinomonadaceae bacterium]|nr:hypothetical protein [Pyrinomonadaceae bacterium]
MKSFWIVSVLIFMAAIELHAQTARGDIKVGTAEWQNVLAKANESAVFENGKLRSLRLTLPNDRERYLTFEHAKDGRSFTIVEDGRRTVTVQLDDQRRISDITFPNGKKVVFEWVQTADGNWLPKPIKADGLDVCNGFMEESGCYDVCQNAAAAAAIAIGVCAAAGPLSTPCWTSTAAATYATYLCYRCANPQIEWPPEN